MYNNLFRHPQNMTPFEKDIHNLVEQFKVEINILYQQYLVGRYMGMWIYGNNYQNSDMRLFKHLIQERILTKYSHQLTENKLQHLHKKITQWINDVISVSESENLYEVIREIETLQSRLSDFKDIQPNKPD